MRLKENTDTISKEKMSKPHICFIPNDVWIEEADVKVTVYQIQRSLFFTYGEISALYGQNCVMEVWKFCASDSKYLSWFCLSQLVFLSNVAALSLCHSGTQVFL